MTSKLTRERLEQLANFKGAPLTRQEEQELARIALAAMDSEPVAWMHNNNNIGIPAITVSQKIGNYWMSEFKDVQPLYRHPQPAPDREQVRREHAEWSQTTFGNVGPVGPLKHLSKEALEAAAEPGDLSEWADMQFLLWDAQRRAGITDEQITQAMIDKLAVNKQREWPEPKDGEPRLHIKEQPAPAFPDFDNVLESLDYEVRCNAWESEHVLKACQATYDACRAAMLHAGTLTNEGTIQAVNSPVIPDGWTGNDKANSALMMLDRIETIDYVDDDRIDGIKRIVRELAAAQQEVK